MKRKSVLRMGVILLSVSFFVGTANREMHRTVLAEEEPIIENTEGVENSVLENAGSRGNTGEADSQEELGILDAGEIVEAQTNGVDVSEPEVSGGIEDGIEIVGEPEVMEEEPVEVVLPKTSVFIPASEFLPVETRENMLTLNPYDDFYFLHFKDDSEMVYTIFFNQELKAEDVALYRFDSEKNKVTDAAPVQDVMSLNENGRVLSVHLKASSDYVFVISNQEKYKELGYTSKLAEVQSQEAESEVFTEAESEPETETESEVFTEAESEPETETESEVFTEPETETETESEALTEVESELETESEAESENETETESETEAPTLTSVLLDLDQDLDTVPVEFLEYLDNLDVYSVTLVYSDGSEKVLDNTDNRYELSVNYEDVSETGTTIRRTYHVTVKERSTGKEFEAAQAVTFGEKEPVEIKTEEMTTVILEGKKKWIMVRSTPEITGRYAMNSNQMIETMYYASEDGEIVSAKDAFTLQEGVTYKFLIELN